MKNTSWKLGAALLAASLTCGMAVNAPAQTKKPMAAKAAGAKKMGGKGGGAVKRAQAIAGKPLTAAQKTAVRAAAATRQKSIKAAQDKFKASVAKALGMSAAQYAAKDKALGGPKGGGKR